MRRESEIDMFGHELFLAGERVPPGRYKQLDSPHVLMLEHEDILPAGLDGRVTCYIRILIWSDTQPLDMSSVLPLLGKR